MIEKLNEIAKIINLDIDMITNNSQTNKISVISTHLRAIGVKTIDITFSGGGDSGDIDSIKFDFVDQSPQLEMYSFESQSFEIYQLMYNWSHEFLNEEITTDWYNNEGGDGNLHFDLIENKFSYIVNYNEIVSHEGEFGERVI